MKEPIGPGEAGTGREVLEGEVVKKHLAVAAAALIAAFCLGAGPASAATFIVDDDGKAAPPSNCNATTPASSSIEAAVEAAPPGSTINVCPGTYTEQVSFEPDDDDTTIRSLVALAAVIQAPPSVAVLEAQSIVHVNGATGVRILQFTITGPGPTTCGSINYGVYVEQGGSVLIQGNHIVDIRDAGPLVSGCQNGSGIRVGRQLLGTTGTATIVGNRIERYQKNGMTIDGVGTRATIQNNTVDGIGPTPFNAQNGIQISRGAFADARYNRISDNAYTGPETYATGFLLCCDSPPDIGPGPAPGTTVASNTVVRNDNNIDVSNTVQARILDNTVLDARRYDGIYMGTTTAENLIRGNFLRGNEEHDCHDDSTGPHTAETANYWIDNDGETENKEGLCVGGHGDDDHDAENDEDGEDHDHVHWTHKGHRWDD